VAANKLERRGLNGVGSVRFWLFGEGIGLRAGVEVILVIHAVGGGASGQVTEEPGLGIVDSEPGDGEAGFGPDEVQAADDGGLGATTFAGHLGGAAQVDAIKSKDLRD